MKFITAFVALTMLGISACSTPQPASDATAPSMDAMGVKTNNADKQKLVDVCLSDRTQNAESCACNVKAMSDTYTQEQYDAAVAAADKGEAYKLDVSNYEEMSPEEQKQVESIMEAGFTCFPLMSDTIIDKACSVAGDDEYNSICNCISRGKKTLSDADFASSLAAAKAGKANTTAGYVALQTTCTSEPGRSFEADE